MTELELETECNDCVLSHSGICGPCRQERIERGLPFMREPEQEPGTWNSDIRTLSGVRNVTRD